MEGASAQYLIPFYSKYNLTPVRASGHWFWDKSGRRYLDLTSGIGVVNMGHTDPLVNKAVIRQLKTITHCSNLFTIEPQAELAKRMTELAFPGKAFFCNSGAEANEAALKIARIYGNAQSPAKNKVIALGGSFHGRTIATITLTGQDKYKKGFEPLLSNIEFIAPNDSAALKSRMDGTVCAVFLEAIQGEGGVKSLNPAFVEEAAALCREQKALLIFDEVQTGIGRTGYAFGYQRYSVTPDIISVAKALGNGIPIGGVLVRTDVADSMPGGMHASTFGGNFVACAAGLAVLNQLTEKKLSRVRESGQYFQQELEAISTAHPGLIKDIRVYGLMIGADFAPGMPVKTIIDGLLEAGIVTIRAGDNTLRLLPPFTAGRQEARIFGQALGRLLSRIEK